jgi:hypothetical protein
VIKIAKKSTINSRLISRLTVRFIAIKSINLAIFLYYRRFLWRTTTFTFFVWARITLFIELIEDIFTNRDSLDSPLSNGIGLVFRLWGFGYRISGIRRTSPVDRISSQFPNSADNQKNVPNSNASNKIHGKTQCWRKKYFWVLL